MKPSAKPADSSPKSPSPAPLTPRRGLFIGIGVVLGVWMIALFAMYWFTVRPEQQSDSSTPLYPNLTATQPVH